MVKKSKKGFICGGVEVRKSERGHGDVERPAARCEYIIYICI